MPYGRSAYVQHSTQWISGISPMRMFTISPSVTSKRTRVVSSRLSGDEGNVGGIVGPVVLEFRSS